MKMKKKNGQDNLLKGVSVAYLIIFLNILLIMAIGLLVLFLSGIVNYMMWILLGGLGLVLSIGFWLYRKIRREGSTLGDMMHSGAFSGQPVEIHFLGGLASLKLGRKEPDFNHQIDYQSSISVPQLEDPETRRLRELKELADLLKKNLISREEYDRLKARLFESETNQESSIL